MDLIRIQSFSGEEGKISDYIASLFLGKDYNIVKDDDNNLFIFINGNEPVLTLNGHLDTVRPVNWKKDPFNPEKIGKNIYGLGSADMKSGLAVMIDIGLNKDFNLPVCLAFTVNEEQGSDSVKDGVETFLENYKTEYAILLEPTVTDDRINVAIGCQGRLEFDIHISGLASHSSIYEKGVNAIYKACDIIKKIRDFSEKLQPRNPVDDLYIKPAISVTKIKAGIAPNIIPDMCVITVDRRYSPDESKDAVISELREITELEPIIVEDRPAFISSKNSRLLHIAKNVFISELGYWSPVIFRGWIDAALFHRAGIDVINLGPGYSGVGHSPEEHCNVDNMVIVEKLILKIISELEKTHR